jgi:uncharacterized protein YndB with AHSA1/START domain
MTVQDMDRIVKRAVLRAPRSRVWRAIADSGEFGAWFGATFEGPFVAGERLAARITEPKEYAGVAFDVWVERVEPERLLSFRWHPYAADLDKDLSQEPTTLVELSLTDIDGGCELTIVESGFDRLTAVRRAEAMPMNSEGWTLQLENIGRYVAR